MTIPEELVTAATDALCDHTWHKGSFNGRCPREHAARKALAAAFAKLPVEELREQAREAVSDYWLDSEGEFAVSDLAHIASDVWLAALTGMVGDVK